MMYTAFSEATSEPRLPMSKRYEPWASTPWNVAFATLAPVPTM